MNNSDIVERALLALGKAGSLRTQLIKTCRHCGITNQDLAQLECGEEINERSIRSTFDWLSKPSKAGFPALLESAPMRLEGRNGRPQRAYWLTEFGRRISCQLDPKVKARVINPRDGKDLHHRFAQLDILTRTLQYGWEAEVEKVIPYAKGKEIRCDVLIQRPEGELYVEIEQELTRNNIERAREKFRNWKAFSISQDFVPDLIFIFNLPNAKLGQTLAIWQEALGDVTQADDFTLDTRYILTGMLEGELLDHALQSYGEWMNPIRTAESDGAASKALSQSAASEVWLPDASELLPEFERRVDRYSNTSDTKDFFELMLYIHEASYGRDSDTFKKSRLPVKSLWLLLRYLNLPQNQRMYEELKQAMIWVQNRSSMGLIMLRNTLCGILWDTFLKRHELAMGGNLRVTLDVPDYVNHNSTFEVKVMFWDKTDETKSDEYCMALAWIMTAFLWYPEILGTGTQPWKKSKKTKGAKQNGTNND
jgi:hypothetical protein